MSPGTRLGIFCITGALLGLSLFPFVVLLAAGGHGTEIPIIIIFPWSQIAARAFPLINDWILGALFLLQMPVYALIIGGLRPRMHRSTLVAVLSVVLLHGFAIVCCFLPQSIYDSFFF